MTRAGNGVGVPSIKLQFWSFRSSITCLKPHMAAQSLRSWNVGDLLCGDIAAAMDIVQECISIYICHAIPQFLQLIGVRNFCASSKFR